MITSGEYNNPFETDRKGTVHKKVHNILSGSPPQMKFVHPCTARLLIKKSPLIFFYLFQFGLPNLGVLFLPYV